MTTPTRVKIALAAIGLGIFFYGQYVGSRTLAWVGIGFLAAAAALRFWKPRDRGGSKGEV